ncbi:hypothetical protein EGR_10722 [Echinococcus granulosus]|uniref:Uncharacterized protein n=1 Tax=Echinococcus granulosus TaxID=6210 RepID=W6U066_ECHGR|nr:hypothetical protein EGR_10722 [Echinococcus granulosus]EUB54423.1 hypothetical protein EGR_10722 [Echinococcus granulosus]
MSLTISASHPQTIIKLIVIQTSKSNSIDDTTRERVICSRCNFFFFSSIFQRPRYLAALILFAQQSSEISQQIQNANLTHNQPRL